MQRTSVWLESLEGGLDYLKQVVIEDSLGVCEQLEKDMNKLVASYQCEWKTTLQTPERLSRFKHFINSEQQDENLSYVTERGQRRPATEAERIQLETVE